MYQTEQIMHREALSESLSVSDFWLQRNLPECTDWWCGSFIILMALVLHVPLPV